MLVRALQKVNITYVTLVSYGMKMNYADCLFIDVFNGPDIPKRFDIGRNVSTPSIPLFDLSEKTVRGTIYPMFGNLGAGYGSVELILDAQTNGMQSLKLKYYARLMRYLKANRITSTLPATNRTN